MVINLIFVQNKKLKSQCNEWDYQYRFILLDWLNSQD
jgi:hypothetical protein